MFRRPTLLHNQLHKQNARYLLQIHKCWSSSKRDDPPQPPSPSTAKEHRVSNRTIPFCRVSPATPQTNPHSKPHTPTRICLTSLPNPVNFPSDHLLYAPTIIIGRSRVLGSSLSASGLTRIGSEESLLGLEKRIALGIRVGFGFSIEQSGYGGCDCRVVGLSCVFSCRCNRDTVEVWSG